MEEEDRRQIEYILRPFHHETVTFGAEAIMFYTQQTQFTD